MSKKTAKKKAAKKKTVKKNVVKKTAASGAEPLGKVQDCTQEIRLAGLGAFSLAQQEGGKIIEQGGKLFEKLVSEGSKLEGKGRKAASETAGGIKDDMESQVGKIRQSARTNWDKLEKVFEQRVARALTALGVPTSDEIKELSAQVAQLNRRVAELARAQKDGAASKARSTNPEEV